MTALSAAAAVVVVFLLSGLPVALSQQPYGYQIADCDNNHNDTGLLGYFCSRRGSPPSCQSYLTFHATPRHPDLASIASLLNADASALAAANSANSSSTSPLAPGTKLLVPVTCTCTGGSTSSYHYQRNASYVAVPGDTLFVIANVTFQGLTTCQAAMEQTLGGGGGGGATPARDLLAGQRVAVPLRCACPSPAQAAAGVRYLVTYLVDEFDEVNAVAARFGVDPASLAAANGLDGEMVIYPFTTLLLPMKSPPDASMLRSPLRPPPPPPPVTAAPAKNRKNHAAVYAGIGGAVAVLAAVAVAAAALVVRSRRRRAIAAAIAGKGDAKTVLSPALTGGEVSVSISEAFSGLSLSDIISSLKVFTHAELAAATDGFSVDRHVGGSVYRAVFDGVDSSVEIVDRDVSAEIDIMRRINHVNLIRLVGVSHHAGRWFLVSEFADHGSLREYLAGAGDGEVSPPAMSWTERVQIGLDVAEGLRYLHGYTRPPHVHMDVSSDSVLLAGDVGNGVLRAKIRNLGGARVIRGGSEGDSAAAFTMTSNIAGRRGYMAQEYVEHGVVSPKADVYSLGVVLLELVTGKDVDELDDSFAGVNAVAGALDGGDEEEVIKRMEELLDPAMEGRCPPREAVEMMVRLIERCVRRDGGGRPGMGEVAQRLLMIRGVSGGDDGWHSSLEHYRSSHHPSS
uniref:Protein kinase domain-containing protein n=1 Tax=Leersia perrieri TaxID=77586 RepID=A0A0D9XT68_9ORYZ